MATVIALILLYLVISAALIVRMWRSKPTAMTEEEVKQPEEWK